MEVADKTSMLYSNASTMIETDNCQGSISIPENFPGKLYKMLSDPQLESIMFWAPDGLSWKIYNHKALEKHLSRYFRHG